MSIPSLVRGVGSTIRVCVSHINDVTDFYLHKHLDMQKLEEISKELYTTYAVGRARDMIIPKWTVGDYCACPSEDNQWYRGLVRYIDPDGIASVFKVDFGDIQRMSIDFLFPLQEKYFETPVLAFHCRLAYLVKPVNGWSKEDIDHFRFQLTTSSLYVGIVSYNALYDISAVTIQDNSGQNQVHHEFTHSQDENSFQLIDHESIYADIPTEMLDEKEINQIQIVHYLRPDHFYVYLSSKFPLYDEFRKHLQKSLNRNQPVDNLYQYQVVAVIDHQALWHRAVVLEIFERENLLSVFYIDIGRIEIVRFDAVRILPREFYEQPAIAIPCSLFGIHPNTLTSEPVWNYDDPIHEEFLLLDRTVDGLVQRLNENRHYDINISIHRIGDFRSYLIGKKLASAEPMSYSGRNGFSSGNMAPRIVRDPSQSTRLLQTSLNSIATSTSFSNRTPAGGNNVTPNNQSQTYHYASAGPPTSRTFTSEPLSVTKPANGMYFITLVRSPSEFYGYSVQRKGELQSLEEMMQSYYDEIQADSSSSALYAPGTIFAIQQGDKYQRARIKDRKEDTKVSLFLVDTGEEIVADISELLRLKPEFSAVPVFAHKFCLSNHKTLDQKIFITRFLKQIILNKEVEIKMQPSTTADHHSVDVFLNSSNINRMAENISRDPKNFQVTIQGVQGTNPSRSAEFRYQSAPLTATQPQIAQPREAVSQVQSDPRPRFTTGQTNFPTQDSYSHASALHNSNVRMPSQDRNVNFDRPGKSQDVKTDTQLNDRNIRNPGERYSTDQRPTDNPVSSGTSWRNQSRPTDRNNEDSERNEGFNNQRSSGRLYQTRTFQSNTLYNSDGNNRQGSHALQNDQPADSQQRYGHRDYSNNQGGNRENRPFYPRSSDQNNRSRERYDDRYDSRRGGYPREPRHPYDNSRNIRGGGYRGNFNQNRQNDRREYEKNDDGQGKPGFSNWNNPPPEKGQFVAGHSFNRFFTPTEEFEFIISELEATNSFYIQLTKNKKNLEDLNDQLQIDFKFAPKLDLNQADENQACLVQDTDTTWYRAKILKKLSSELEIIFVDYGNKLLVKSNQVRQLEERFCNHPLFGIPCRLDQFDVPSTVPCKKLINELANKVFNGQIVQSNSTGPSLLKCEELKNIFMEGTRQQKGPTLKRTACTIVHVDDVGKYINIQDDYETKDRIQTLIEEEAATSETLSLNEIEQLSPNEIILALYEEEYYRGIVTSILGNNQVQVFYIDFGNTDNCSVENVKKCSSTLKNYPKLLKMCRLHDVNGRRLEKAMKFISDNSDSTEVEISVINEKDGSYDVLLYIGANCVNHMHMEISNEIEGDEQQNQPKLAATNSTVQNVASGTASEDNAVASTIEQSETNEPTVLTVTRNDVLKQNEDRTNNDVTATTDSVYQKGFLVFNEPDQPVVYLQILPECDNALSCIEKSIEMVQEKGEQKSEYQIGEYVVAQYQMDEIYYRARIISHSSASDTYQVYFIDFGNVDENVSREQIYSYSEDLEKIPPQAHRYSLHNVSTETWQNKSRQIIESLLQTNIEFEVVDEQNSIIRLQVPDYENDQPTDSVDTDTDKNAASTQLSTNPTGISSEIEETSLDHEKIEQLDETLSPEDSCPVLDDVENNAFARRTTTDEENLNVEHIDHENTVTNRGTEQLSVLPDNVISQENDLAAPLLQDVIDDDNSRELPDDPISLSQADEKIDNDSETSNSVTTVHHESKHADELQVDSADVDDFPVSKTNEQSIRSTDDESTNTEKAETRETIKTHEIPLESSNEN